MNRFFRREPVDKPFSTGVQAGICEGRGVFLELGHFDMIDISTTTQEKKGPAGKISDIYSYKNLKIAF